MQRVRSAILALAAALLAPQLALSAPALVILVRHAEKSTTPVNDPILTRAGQQRAAELSRVVATWRAAGASVKKLFATEAKRTQLTLAPLAAATGLTVTQVVAADTAGLVTQILAVNGGVVVVAGHTNTLPVVIQALGGPAGITIAETEYSRLFVFRGTGAHGAMVAMRYGKP